jgi:KRAB domain-containing zinc finger protein
MKIHENVREFNCDQCFKGFVTKKDLIQHMWNHESFKKFNCGKCNRGFNNSSYFKAHLLSHSTNPRKLQCDLCPNTYPTKRKVQEHLLATHFKRLSSAKLFSCQMCKKKFKTKSNFRKHREVHRTTKDFECKTCGKLFRFRNNLRIHEQCVHGENLSFFFDSKMCSTFSFNLDEDNNFTCSQCPKSFKAKRYLRDHERRHLNAETEICPICSKQIKKKNFKQHLSKSKCSKEMNSIK